MTLESSVRKLKRVFDSHVQPAKKKDTKRFITENYRSTSFATKIDLKFALILESTFHWIHVRLVQNFGILVWMT